MTPNIYNPKIHHKKLLTILILAAVVVMFLVRGILYQTGTLEKIQTLEPDELHQLIARYEVQITDTFQEGNDSGNSADSSDHIISRDDHSDNGAAFNVASGNENVNQDDVSGTVISGRGTILDGRKNSTSDENYTLTIVTACHVAGGVDGQNGAIKVTLPDGTETDGTLLYADPTADIAFVQCESPDEIDVYYSRDILERLSADDPVYALKSGNLVTGSVAATKQEISGIGSDLTIVNMNNEGGMSGAGIYGAGGNYLGMIVQGTDDGKTACVSAVEIMKALNDSL